MDYFVYRNKRQKRSKRWRNKILSTIICIGYYFLNVIIVTLLHNVFNLISIIIIAKIVLLELEYIIQIIHQELVISLDEKKLCQMDFVLMLLP